ncbi:MAG: RDD family protein [Bacilli bacterium]
MKNIKFKRIVAYFLDVCFVFFLSTAINQINFINRDMDNYQKTYDEYEEIIGKTSMDELVDFSKSDEYNELAFKIDLYSKSNLVIIFVVYLLYFGVFQKFNKGKTIGKNIMKIKVVDENGENPSLFTFLLRTFILFGLYSNVLYLIFINTMNANDYMMYKGIVSSLVVIVFYTSALLILFKKDGKGIHEYLTKTKVIEESV